MKVKLVRASKSDHATLENLLQLYLHDFSEFVGGAVPSDEGRFSYPKLPLYWTEAGRAAYLIRAADRLAGFALITRGSLISGDPNVWDVAEFFVVRGIRRHGVGREAAHAVFRSEAGAWEVRVRDDNQPALAFWRRVIAEFTNSRFTVEPRKRDDETGWQVFRFTNPEA